MPASAVLNPVQIPSYDNAIGDSLTPNYGFTRKRTITKLQIKPSGGVPYTRDTQNTGHRFSFSWIDRNYTCVQLIKQFYEQFEDGFFTIIDWDGGGRHYVGRFVTEVIPVETDNDKWSILNAEFEEIPTVAMLEYPSDWNNDAVWEYVLNDFGDVKVASYIAGTGGAWTTAAPIVDGPMVLCDLTPAVGDWAQYEYHGYGFQLYMVNADNMGYFTIALDGVLLDNPSPITGQAATVFDGYSALAAHSALALSYPDVPLDFHRVMVSPLATKDDASLETRVIWYALQVMR